VAKLFVDSGLIALSSFISPYRADRDQVRALHDAADMAFIEIFVDCSLEAAESRDPKGLYKKARAGEIKNFTGIDDPYEAPTRPEIHLHSDRQSLAEEVAEILRVLRGRGIIAS
jgi:adenylylsulfate kinase